MAIVTKTRLVFKRTRYYLTFSVRYWWDIVISVEDGFRLTAKWCLQLVFKIISSKMLNLLSPSISNVKTLL